MNRNTCTYHEIIRQASLWKNALSHLNGLKKEYNKLVEQFSDRIWVFTGCGTSYYLAQTASTIFESLTGIPTRAVPASEILLFPQNVFNKKAAYLLIPISRSGTSTEIILANLKVRQELNLPSLAVSCSPHSTLVQDCPLSLTFPFIPEESVVMTGSFTTMLLAIIHLGLCHRDIFQLLPRLPELAHNLPGVLNEYETEIEKIATQADIGDFIFLGQGPFFGIANEAALKIQEMSLSFAQSYHSLEYRHGPKSTATQHTLITLLFSEAGKNYQSSLVNDLKSLGAKTMLIGASEDIRSINSTDHRIEIPGGLGDLLNPLLYIPLLQLLGYFKAKSKDLNPDNPRNLTAVVEFQMTENGQYE